MHLDTLRHEIEDIDADIARLAKRRTVVARAVEALEALEQLDEHAPPRRPPPPAEPPADEDEDEDTAPAAEVRRSRPSRQGVPLGDSRRLVLEALQKAEAPGVTIAGLVDRTGLQPDTLRYHLKAIGPRPAAESRPDVLPRQPARPDGLSHPDGAAVRRPTSAKGAGSWWVNLDRGALSATAEARSAATRKTSATDIPGRLRRP